MRRKAKAKTKSKAKRSTATKSKARSKAKAKSKSRGRAKRPVKAKTYKHNKAKRKNNPEAGLVDFEPKQREMKEYCWDPRESPQLIWAGKAGMNKVEVEEQTSLEIPVVNLHIHERVSTEAILRTAKRQDIQRSLFEDPELEFADEIRFYQHDVNWSNRMILGDSLLVMNSLVEREQMRGKVQMIYMDPPYGIKYASNFQPKIDQRQVQDGKDDDLSREVEVVQAFRDTWELGVHSYLSYLRDRLFLCRELLADTGSIFVQIGDENVHRVRCLMDEVFGEENFVLTIVFKKKGATTVTEPVNDYVLWFARNRSRLPAINRLFERRARPEGDSRFNTLVSPEGQFIRVTGREPDEVIDLANSGHRWARVNYPIVSQDWQEGRSQDFLWRDKAFTCGGTRHWSFDPETDMTRLAVADRLFDGGGASLGGVVYWDDWPYTALSNMWDDLHGEQQVVYAVQTNRKVIERCMLVATAPGDLVLDPTCGSGTTAYAAEKWGRRWITMDTSRVALAIARHRLMTEWFDYYRLLHPRSGVTGGFDNNRAPRVTLADVARNEEIDTVSAEYQPQLDKALAALNRALKTEWQEWEVLREADAGWSKKATEAHGEFWRLMRERRRRIEESIQRNAPQEELVDDPVKEPGIVRVSGPFTMESIPHPGEISMEVESETIPTDDGELAVTLISSADAATRAANAAAYVGDMVEKLRRTGVHVRGRRKVDFESLRPVDHEIVHAEGEFTIPKPRKGEEVHPDEEALAGEQVRCAVVFGPENGAVSEVLVRDAVRAAAPYDAILFCGYDFTAPAQEVINSDPVPGKRLLMAFVAADTAMTDLLKDTKTSQIFTMVGEPDVVVYRKDDPSLAELLKDAVKREVPEVAQRAKRLGDGELFIELRGVDLYDPLSGEVATDHGSNVHAYFIDHNYDGKSFCVCQALFPNRKDSWDKIGKNLKGTINPEAFEAMRTLVSLPFKPGEEGKVQVKVIDARGNAVVKVIVV